MPTKTKIIPVKNLRKAIQDGMSHKEAGEHALKILEPKLNMFSEGVDQTVDMEYLIEILVEEYDHSIKFEVEEDRGNELLSWDVQLYKNGESMWNWDSSSYYGSSMDHAEYKAEEDAKTLNQFILDFYGIKKHETTKGMARTKAKQIRAEIAEKQKEIKALQAELKKIAKIP